MLVRREVRAMVRPSRPRRRNQPPCPVRVCVCADGRDEVLEEPTVSTRRLGRGRGGARATSAPPHLRTSVRPSAPVLSRSGALSFSGNLAADGLRIVPRHPGGRRVASVATYGAAGAENQQEGMPHDEQTVRLRWRRSRRDLQLA